MRQRDPQKIEALFQATLVVCGREGTRGLTVPAIVQEAGLAVGTFYTYFDGKEALLKELYLRIKAESGAEILRGLQPGDPLKSTFKRLSRNYFDYRVANYLAAYFQEQYHASAYLDDETRSMSQAAMQPFVELLRRGQAEELIKPGDPLILLQFVLATLREAANLAVFQAQLDRSTLAEAAIQFCWDGISG